jgi:putative flippase GtrA
MSQALSLKGRVDEFRAWSKTHEGKKIVRFLMVSVISTVTSEGVILAVYGFNWTHSPMWASAIGNLTALPLAYYLHRQWAWGKTGASHWRKEVMPYIGINVLGLLVSLIGAAFCRHLVYTHHLSHLVNTLLVGGVNLASFGVFWVLKLLLFNRIFHTNPIAAFDEHLTAEEQKR